jgi:hypothetical protein
VITTSACVDRHVLPALFSTQFINKVYEFKTPFVKWKQIFEKMCENNEENIPPEVFEAARKATLNLLPQKSRQQYELVFKKFNEWCIRNKVEMNVTENVCLAYFADRAKHVKPSSLWSEYSMVKSSLLIKKNIDLKHFFKLTAFMKRQSAGYQCKKSKVFSKDQIYKFINEAPDETYLMMKVNNFIVIIFN